MFSFLYEPPFADMNILSNQHKLGSLIKQKGTKVAQAIKVRQEEWAGGESQVSQHLENHAALFNCSAVTRAYPGSIEAQLEVMNTL